MTYRTEHGFIGSRREAAASAAESIKVRCSRILVLVGILLTPPAFAQTLTPKPAPEAAENKPAEKPLEDPLGRSTPYGTVQGFLNAAEKHDYERAAEYLDSKQPSEQKQELARHLKLIMDRGLAVNLDTLSREPEGKMEEGLRSTRELVGVARIGSESLEILLDRIQRGANPPIWLFSGETLLSVPAIAEKIQPGWMELHLPKVLLEKRLLSVQLYRWLAALIAIPLFLIITWLLTRGLAFTLGRAVRRLTSERGSLPDLGLRGPIRLLIFTLLIRLGSNFAVSLAARQFWTRVATVVGVLALVWLYIRLTDALAAVMARRLRRTNAPGELPCCNSSKACPRRSHSLLARSLFSIWEGSISPQSLLDWVWVGLRLPSPRRRHSRISLAPSWLSPTGWWAWATSAGLAIPSEPSRKLGSAQRVSVLSPIRFLQCPMASSRG